MFFSDYSNDYSSDYSSQLAYVTEYCCKHQSKVVACFRPGAGYSKLDFSANPGLIEL